MIYFPVIGILIAILLKRNPLSIVTNVEFRVPYLLIGCFLIQILLEILAVKNLAQLPFVLNLTFVGVLFALFLNRHLAGVKWVFTGTLLNLAALITHGGLMPVSQKAMEMAGLQHLVSVVDSRHQLMTDSAFWWLGDWIPFLTPIGNNYVMSLGDILVGIGILLFIIQNSKQPRANRQTDLSLD